MEEALEEEEEEDSLTEEEEEEDHQPQEGEEDNCFRKYHKSSNKEETMVHFEETHLNRSKEIAPKQNIL